LTKLYGHSQGKSFQEQLFCASITHDNCIADSCANFQIILLTTAYCGNIYKKPPYIDFFLDFSELNDKINESAKKA